MEKAIAVVVSYNRQALLSECISALKNQTRKPDAILVVNNGSTDNTEAWLKDQKNIFFITQPNLGSGGGFNSGITWAYQKGYSWIWCMDDDGYPKEDALENLLKHEGNERGLLNCAVVNKFDKKSFVWKTGNYATIDEVKEEVIAGIGHPFNGTLIHRSIVERVGVPRSALFLWGDETEYYYRIVRKNNYPVKTVATSIHYHPPAAFTYKKDWEFSSSWKMYFYVRNRFHVHKAKCANRVSALLHYSFFLLAFAGIIMVYQKTDRLRKLNFIVWPALDAVRNSFDVMPADVLSKLNTTRSRNPLRVSMYFKNIWLAIFSPYTLMKRSETANA